VRAIFEQKRERILLAVVLGLLAIVALERLALAPLYEYFSGTDAEIARLQAELAMADRDAAEASRWKKAVAQAEQAICGPDEQDLNELRRYLESLAGDGVKVSGSKLIGRSPMPDAPDLMLVTYELQMVGPLDPQLRLVLERLDRSRRLLRVDNLQITRTTEDGPLLNMTMTISAIARGPSDTQDG